MTTFIPSVMLCVPVFLLTKARSEWTFGKAKEEVSR
jgi:hypothetical protein